jgi:hypothetical protein
MFSSPALQRLEKKELMKTQLQPGKQRESTAQLPGRNEIVV